MRRRRVTYRPNKTQTAIGGAVGTLFVLLGIFVVIPASGVFGVFWTLIAAAITVGNLYQGFGKKYLGPEISIEEEPEETESPEARLQQLQSLLDQGLITREEYSSKRAEILREL